MLEEGVKKGLSEWSEAIVYDEEESFATSKTMRACGPLKSSSNSRSIQTDRPPSPSPKILLLVFSLLIESEARTVTTTNTTEVTSHVNQPATFSENWTIKTAILELKQEQIFFVIVKNVLVLVLLVFFLNETIRIILVYLLYRYLLGLTLIVHVGIVCETTEIPSHSRIRIRTAVLHYIIGCGYPFNVLGVLLTKPQMSILLREISQDIYT
ncbi:hypothetical protein M0802_002286 [Mischocyttarus mexicanus]|nr:hypothetical protein M0802_002286 [Mischocyttarus mexicanus]